MLQMFVLSISCGRHNWFSCRKCTKKMYHLTHSVRFLCIKCRKCHGKINWCHQMGMGRWLKLSPEHFSIQNDRIQKKLRSKCDNDAKLMIFQFPHDWIQRKVQKTCFPPLKAYWLPSSIHVSRLWKAVPRLGAALNWSNRNGHNGRLKKNYRMVIMEEIK